MNENEFKLLWQSANEKLLDGLSVNKKNTEDITRLKIDNLLSSMKPIKLFTVGAGILWVFLLGGFTANLLFSATGSVSPFFLGSASIQILLTAIAIGFYIYQLNLIAITDFSEPVLAIQEKLSKLKVSTLNVTRILYLQLPVWTTFYWNEKMFVADNLILWIIQGAITLTFTVLALWLFFNINYENRNKKWFQWIFKGKEWQPILQSMELLSQIENYQEQGDKIS